MTNNLSFMELFHDRSLKETKKIIKTIIENKEQTFCELPKEKKKAKNLIIRTNIQTTF
jgi:hypothetical protein